MLRVQFWRIENIVVMKVLEQGEEIKRGIGIIYSGEEGIKIRSYQRPAIERENDNFNLFIRGMETEKDNEVVCERFKDSEQAREFIERAVQAIHEYNINTGETKEETTDIETVIAE